MKSKNLGNQSSLGRKGLCQEVHSSVAAGEGEQALCPRKCTVWKIALLFLILCPSSPGPRLNFLVLPNEGKLLRGGPMYPRAQTRIQPAAWSHAQLSSGWIHGNPVVHLFWGEGTKQYLFVEEAWQNLYAGEAWQTTFVRGPPTWGQGWEQTHQSRWRSWHPQTCRAQGADSEPTCSAKPCPAECRLDLRTPSWCPDTGAGINSCFKLLNFPTSC